MSSSTEVLSSAASTAWGTYKSTTAFHLKVIDVFLVYFASVAVIQFAYCAVLGSFPFNSFLSGFLSAVGMFILTGGSWAVGRWC